MALGDYTPTAWVNGTTPAISATNLGKIEAKLDEIDAASAATSSTRIWSTANDGNGGQPPAGKASVITSAPLAQNQYISFSMSTSSIYLVTAYHVNGGGAANVSKIYMVSSGGGILSTTLGADTANLSISTSSLDVRITQLNASSSAVVYGVNRL